MDYPETSGRAFGAGFVFVATGRRLRSTLGAEEGFDNRIICLILPF
jgi:hypothetical protein